MKHKDPDRIDAFTSEAQEKSYKDPYSSWKKNGKVKFGENTPKMSRKLPLTRFGFGFLILIILLILLFSRNQSDLLENRIVALENRVKDIEKTVDGKDAVEDRVAQIWEKAQTIEQFKERLDRSEAALTSKMNQLETEQDRLQKQMAEVRIKKAKPSKTEKASQKVNESRYHTVKSGETLYKIGRQYGLTVQKLRLINKLGNGDAIYPGQSLLVSP